MTFLGELSIKVIEVKADHNLPPLYTAETPNAQSFHPAGFDHYRQLVDLEM